MWDNRVVRRIAKWLIRRRQILMHHAHRVALGSAVSSNFESGVWVKDTLTARADGEQVTRFVNVGELLPDATITNVRIYEFDSKFQLTNVRLAKSGTFQPPGHWLLIVYET